jgi:hypothetical protein
MRLAPSPKLKAGAIVKRLLAILKAFDRIADNRTCFGRRHWRHVLIASKEYLLVKTATSRPVRGKGAIARFPTRIDFR